MEWNKNKYENEDLKMLTLNYQYKDLNVSNGGIASNFCFFKENMDVRVGGRRRAV